MSAQETVQAAGKIIILINTSHLQAHQILQKRMLCPYQAHPVPQQSAYPFNQTDRTTQKLRRDPRLETKWQLELKIDQSLLGSKFNYVVLFQKEAINCM